jgi:ribosomal protein S27AE
VAYVLIALGFALAGGIVGRLKGSSFFLWFLISGILPFVGLIAALLYRSDRDELRRQCPRCGRIVMLHDAVCTRCGAELDYPDVVLAPESATPGPRAS